MVEAKVISKKVNNRRQRVRIRIRRVGEGKVVPCVVETVKVPRQILSMELEPGLSANQTRRLFLGLTLK